MSILSKISVEHGPSTLTSLIQIITSEELLHGELRNILSSLKLEAGLYGLYEGDRVTSTAMFLTPHWVCEVMTVDVSEIVCFRKLFVWNVVSNQVGFGPCLGTAEGLFESCCLGIC